MALSIHSEYVNPQLTMMQKFQQTYKQAEVPEKKVTHNPNSANQDVILNIRNMSTNDIREILSTDEKRTLNEVFGDKILDKNTLSPYNDFKFSSFLKGTKIDVKL